MVDEVGTFLGNFTCRAATLVSAFIFGSGLALAEDGMFANVCRAAISSVMGQSPSIIKLDKVGDAIVNVSYRRPTDGSKWSYRCKFEGSRLWWATSDGRWRDGPLDEIITFSINSNANAVTIMQLYSDGSKTTDVFPASGF